jgi:type II secretory pathway component PulF
MRQRGLSESAWALLVERLAQLLEAGVPLLVAIRFLAERGRPAVRSQAARVAERLFEGQPLSACLGVEDAPLVIRTLVEVGEHNGDMAGSLFRSAEYCKERVKWRRESLQAMVYPLFVCAVLVIVTWFLFAVVVPRFAGLYAGMGLPVGGGTAWLFWVAEAWQEIFLGVSGSLLAVVFGRRVTVLKRQLAGRQVSYWQQFPVLREWVVVTRTHEWAATLGLLLDGGLPLVQALAVQEQLPLAPENAAMCARVRERVLKGEMLSRALENEPLEEGVVLAVQVAEVTGDLPRALLAVEKEMALRRKQLMEVLLKLVEPLLLVLIGLLVGAVAWLLLMPMMDLMDAIP